MIVDFSLRPPYKSLANMESYRRRPEDTFAARIGLTPSRAYRERSMDLLLDEMDEAGIVHAACHGRARDGSKNADLLDLMTDYPGKFTAFADINLSDLGAAAAEAGWCLDMGFVGVTLEPGLSPTPMYPDDAGLYPIYELCQQRGGHVLLTLSAYDGPDISYSSPVHLDRVAADFPSVNLIVRHACWPWVTEACGVALRRRTVHLIPDAYGVNMPGHMQWVEAANTYLADRLLFGTAFPIVPLKPIVDAFHKLPFRDDVREKVEYGNAARLLNLPA